MVLLALRNNIAWASPIKHGEENGVMVAAAAAARVWQIFGAYSLTAQYKQSWNKDLGVRDEPASGAKEHQRIRETKSGGIQRPSIVST